MTAILCTDFWIVRRQKLKIPDLYQQDGIYWYTFGFNWRAITAFVIAIFPSLPGFAGAVSGKQLVAVGWTRVYQLSYFVGFAIAALLYFTLSHFFPPPGLGVMQLLDDSDAIDGIEVFDQSPASSSAVDVGKEAAGISEKVIHHV